MPLPTSAVRHTISNNPNITNPNIIMRERYNPKLSIALLPAA